MLKMHLMPVQPSVSVLSYDLQLICCVVPKSCINCILPVHFSMTLTFIQYLQNAVYFSQMFYNDTSKLHTLMEKF